MTPAADISPSAPQDACGPAVHDKAVRERQLQLLGDLAEIGLEVARAIEREAKAEAPPPAAELALAYARVSRAVRLTIQLQTQVLDGPAAKPEPAPAPAPAEASPREVRRDRVVNIVERVAKESRDDSDEVEELVYEASERLDDEDLYGDLMDHPVSEIVARICKDLGLRPDWKALSEELWAKREMQEGEVGEPLRRFRPGAAGVPSLEPPRLPSSSSGQPLLGELGALGGDSSFAASLPGAGPLSPFRTAPPLAGEHAPLREPPPS